MLIEWVHGLEGSPNGRKVQALRAAGHTVQAGDYNGLPLAARVALLEERTAASGPIVLCGSSYGGLTSAIVAQRHPSRFAGLLLCAPALAFLEEPVVDVEAHRAPPSLPTIVLHATADAICPFAASEAYAARSGDHVELVPLDDKHNLEGSLPEVVDALGRLLQRVDP